MDHILFCNYARKDWLGIMRQLFFYEREFFQSTLEIQHFCPDLGCALYSLVHKRVVQKMDESFFNIGKKVSIAMESAVIPNQILVVK